MSAEEAHREAFVRDVVGALPPGKRKDVMRAAKAGGMSVGSAVALALAAENLRTFAPPGERAKVAALLLNMMVDKP